MTPRDLVGDPRVAVSVTARDWAALEQTLAGELLLPGSESYERARRPAMENFRHARPQAIALCRTPEDVSETLAFARRHEIPATPRSGGHCFAGRSSTDGIVIDVSPMSTVSVSDGAATVGAGTRLAHLYDALDERGLTLPAGCGPDVGIAGLTLGGGLGILGRSHGLTCDRLRAARVVLADGRIVECDEDRHPDLFWALRGAGGCQFGIVTSLVFEPVPAPEATTFHLVWPHAAADAVIAAWQEWAPEAPDELDAALRLTPDRVHLFGAMLATEAETVATIDPLVVRTGTDPDSASHAQLPYREVKRSLVGLGADEDQPRERLGKSELFSRTLPAEAIRALVDNLASDRDPGEPRELNFTAWGGAYNRVPPAATAFAHRDQRFMVEHVALTSPETQRAAEQWLARSWACTHPSGSGRVYPNFPDPALENWPEAYHGGNLERLRRVKQAYDPQRTFRFPQSL